MVSLPRCNTVTHRTVLTHLSRSQGVCLEIAPQSITNSFSLLVASLIYYISILYARCLYFVSFSAIVIFASRYISTSKLCGLVIAQSTLYKIHFQYQKNSQLLHFHNVLSQQKRLRLLCIFMKIYNINYFYVKIINSC